MFTSEADKFLSGNNNVNCAKTLINECKRLINDLQIQGNSDYTNCKNNIETCDIDGLVKLIEDTKESLFKLDQNFASEYMTLIQEFLQTSDLNLENMSEEERLEYNIKMDAYSKDYNYNLLYMLEKYEESGNLTPEMQQQLEIQRTIVKQYDIQDKMVTLDPTSDEYIGLFKEIAEYNKKIINLNPNLTEEQKASYLKEYETQYNTQLTALQQAHDVKVKNDELEAELKNLYALKEENSGFFHPFVEGEIEEAILDKKIEIGQFNPDSVYAATTDEINYKNMNGWDRFWTNTGTVAVSTFTGLYGVTESVEDGIVMLGGRVGICDQNWAAEHVNMNQADNLYDRIVDSTGMNQYSGYGNWHTVGTTIGSTLGYAGLSFLPGGAGVTATVGGLSAMGNASQRALNSGAGFDQAFDVGFISGITGAVAGGVTNRVQGLAGGATSLLGAGGYALAGMGAGSIEPIINSLAEYYLYGKDMVDENGNPVYANVFDYYVESGGAQNTIMGMTAGGISTGIKGIKGYNNYQKVYNSINNLGDLSPAEINELKSRFNQMSNKQVYEVVQNSDNTYFKESLKTYDLITRSNAAEFIIFDGYNSNYNTASFNLDWPDHAGYDPKTITSIKKIIDNAPDGKFEVSRVGGDNGHAIGTDLTSTSSQRSIPSSTSTAHAGVFDGKKYIDAVDICSSNISDLDKVKALQKLGYDSAVSNKMVREFNSFNDLPEIGGSGGLNEVLDSSQHSKYGYSGQAAAWKTKSVKMEGGAGQMNSIFSWGTLKESGILSVLPDIVV